MLTFPHDTTASVRAWIAPMALWLQSEPITFSCCTRLGPHFSFIHPRWWKRRSGRAVFPPSLLYFPTSSSPPLPAPRRRSLSEQNFKMCLDARWNIREEIWRHWEKEEGDSLYFTPALHTHRHAHFFFALSTKSLLQKGESGQKTGSLITLSSNLILIFRRCKREPWKREAAVETKGDDEWKMKDKMKWMKETKGGGGYKRGKGGGGGHWREKVDKS